MTIGISGNGNIARILQWKCPNQTYMDLKTCIDFERKNLDFIILTKPGHVYISNENSYSKIFISKIPKLFIPGNALNKELITNTFKPVNIYWTVETPFVGRFTNEHNFSIRKNMRIYKTKNTANHFSKGLKLIEKIFQMKLELVTEDYHYLSNIFIHPLRVIDLFKNGFPIKQPFYNFSIKLAIQYKLFDLETMKMAGKVFGYEFKSGYKHYESKTPQEFRDKLFSISSFKNIDFIAKNIQDFVQHRYFNDDIMFKLKYLADRINIDDFPITKQILLDGVAILHKSTI